MAITTSAMNAFLDDVLVEVYSFKYEVQRLNLICQ